MSDYIGNNLYALLADALVFLHLCYLVFTVGGEAAILAGWIRGWVWIRNRVFRFLHLASVLLVALEALLGIWCPLTVWEYRMRRAAGQMVEEDISFVGRLIRMILFYEFPPLFFTLLYIGFGGLVLLTLIYVPPAKKDHDK
jgi:hypothetical protein